MIEIKSFKNLKGKDISYLSIPVMKKDGGTYEAKIGFKKAQAVLDHAEEIEGLLKENERA